MLVTELCCLRCGATYPMDATAYTCPACASHEGGEGDDPGILEVRYDYFAAGRALAGRARGAEQRRDIFRYLPLLPVDSSDAMLSAGATPLVSVPRLAARLGLAALYLKDETRNPCGGYFAHPRRFNP